MSAKRWDALIDRLPRDRTMYGAEVGVWDGRMSEKLLAALPNLHLYLVDLWRPPKPGDSYYDSGSSYAREPESTYVEVYKKMLDRVIPYWTKVSIFMADSVKCASKMGTQSFDFVFLDADHSYRGVMRDLDAWMPKVKPGGWLCGHDYDHPEQGEVKRAVDEYLRDWPGVIEIDVNRTWFYRMPGVDD